MSPRALVGFSGVLVAPGATHPRPISHPASAYTIVYFNGAGRAPRILIIGDSSLAGVRWNGGADDPTKNLNFMFDAGSCRRTTTTSRGGREGYRPDTALTTLQRLGDGHEVLVMAAGYNDPGSRSPRPSTSS